MIHVRFLGIEISIGRRRPRPKRTHPSEPPFPPGTPDPEIASLIHLLQMTRAGAYPAPAAFDRNRYDPAFP